ncbi:MAG: DUF4097 family beta strand repeat protein [Oscillospiraceae bacterium]|nr:DUF4097 family beta strand repeat protein [Oscillospiraceae bacterium]
MKQSKIVWLIVAGALVLLGAILFVCIMAANDWDFSRLSTSKYENRTVEIAEDFQNISIRSETEDIDFVLTDDGSCKVVLYEREKVTHSVDVANGTLSIKQMDTRKWYDNIAVFSTDSPKITVYLPRNEYAALSIEESTGDISLPGEIGFESIQITASTGDITCFSSASKSIRVQTSTGHIRLEKLSAGEIDLTASTGRIELRSVECAGALRVGVSTGRVELSELRCESLASTGSTGDITLKQVTAAGKMEIERSTGDVRFEQSDAGELFIETDTGDVTGSLRSAKIFFTQSDTGHIEVPETTTGGKCKITTDTGDIEISVAD